MADSISSVFNTIEQPLSNRQSEPLQPGLPCTPSRLPSQTQLVNDADMPILTRETYDDEVTGNVSTTLSTGTCAPVIQNS
jgi:hypothetical protein